MGKCFTTLDTPLFFAGNPLFFDRPRLTKRTALFPEFLFNRFKCIDFHFSFLYFQIINTIRMKILFLILFVSIFGSLSAHELNQNQLNRYKKVLKDSTNKLLPKKDTLELRYLIWGCECPNWISLTDYKIAQQSGKLNKYCIYIESKNGAYQLPEDFDPEKHSVQLTGHFYEKEDIPDELLNSEEPAAKARIFQFTEMKIARFKNN